MSGLERQFTLKLAGKSLKDGKVSVRLLIKALNNIQKVAYHLGDSRLNSSITLKGRKKSLVERQCELFLLKAEPGSLTTTISFPPKEADLASELPDLAEKVISDLKNVFKSVSKRDHKLFKSTIYDSECQRVVLAVMEELLPSPKEDYELYYKFDEDEQFESIVKLDKNEIEMFIDEDNKKEDLEVEEEVIEIQAHCKAIINSDGKPSIKEVLDYKTISDTRPYRINSFIIDNQEYILKHEIACAVRKEEDYILIEYEPLDIEAYGLTREEAIEAFNEELAMIWSEYGLENNVNLTQDAIILKEKINDLVKGVQIIEFTKDQKN